MARTITEIKKEITDAFMNNATVREMYGISGDESFERVFSPVSLESILFYLFAASAYVLEVMFDTFKTDVDAKIAQAIVASIPWYYKIARQFQYGDELVFDERTQAFVYAVVDESKQVVKYVAVRDMGGSVMILASGETDGRPSPLPDDVLLAFKAYLNKVKIAGIILSVRSMQADRLRLEVAVQIDPMVLKPDGTRISDGRTPVKDAVNAYLSGIVYGGTFNKTKLVDAIQEVDGVADVTLGSCMARPASVESFAEIQSNNYTAIGGSFIADSLDTTITYVV